MGHFLGRILQIVIDVVVGLATFYIFTGLVQTSATTAVIISLIITAIFAEVFEIRLKSLRKPRIREE